MIINFIMSSISPELTNNTNTKDIESQMKISGPNDTQNGAVVVTAKEKYICTKLCTFLFVFIIASPFIVCDLYFAYNSISCQRDSNPVGLELSTWLQVNGYVTIGVLVTSLILLVTHDNYEIPLSLKILRIISSLFSITWLIIGSVIFWGTLINTGKCESNISNYMWARLILGFISVWFNNNSSKKDKK